MIYGDDEDDSAFMPGPEVVHGLDCGPCPRYLDREREEREGEMDTLKEHP